MRQGLYELDFLKRGALLKMTAHVLSEAIDACIEVKRECADIYHDLAERFPEAEMFWEERRAMQQSLWLPENIKTWASCPKA